MHSINNPLNVSLENTSESPGSSEMWIVERARRESFEMGGTFQDRDREKRGGCRPAFSKKSSKMGLEIFVSLGHTLRWKNSVEFRFKNFPRGRLNSISPFPVSLSCS